MIEYLPYSGFKLLKQNEMEKFVVNSIGENSFIGYILEVEYPDALHELHNDYPLTSEKTEISHYVLSNYCSSITNEYDKNGGVNQLVPNLGNKSKYVLHYRNFQLYLSLGMKLIQFRRVLKFKQSDCYADKRKDAANNFEKDVFKLVNSSIYGKTMENLRKIIKVRLFDNAKDNKKYVSKPSFASQKIFNGNFVAIHEIKTSFNT